MPSTCPICLSADTKHLFMVGEYSIHRCRACSGGFAEPRVAPADSHQIYGAEYFEAYHASAMEGQEFAATRFLRLREQIGPLLEGRAVERPRRILDVGCASGYLLREFAQAGWECTGVELSRPAIDFGRRQLGLDIVEGDFLESSLERDRFDLITMFHVIEHFPDPRMAVARAYDLLNANGILFIETPNWDGIGALLTGVRWSHYIPPEHLNFLGPRSLHALLHDQQFDRVQTRTFTPPVLVGIRGLPLIFQGLARAVYRVAAWAGLGASLEAVAAKPSHP